MSWSELPQDVLFYIFHQRWFEETESRHHLLCLLLGKTTVSLGWRRAIMASIEEIVLSPGVTDAVLKSLPNLTRLRGTGGVPNVTAEGIASLSRLRYLERPPKWHCVDDVLLKLPSLTHLTLCHSKNLLASDAELLVRLTGLRSLFLFNIQNCQILTHQLPLLTGLLALRLSHGHKVRCSHIRPLTNLTSLHLESCYELDGDCFRTLSGLTSLTLKGSAHVTAGLHHVAPTLTRLCVDRQSLPSYQEITSLTRLERIEISNVELYLAAFIPLLSLTRLQSIETQGRIFTRQDLLSLENTFRTTC
jgi:hypothetical protein